MIVYQFVGLREDCRFYYESAVAPKIVEMITFTDYQNMHRDWERVPA